VGEHAWRRVQREYAESLQAWSALGPASTPPTFAGLHARATRDRAIEKRIGFFMGTLEACR
jgi:hypothetical protein